MIRLVVFDWAGTTVDYGCFAPVAAFVESFARHRVAVTSAQARGPMGLHKRDHIAAMLRDPAVAEAWRSRHLRDATESDIDSLFAAFVPLQLAVVERHSDLLPGVVGVVNALRQRGVKIGSTTGYFREAAVIVRRVAEREGYAPDCSLIPEDVTAGRPHPWMMFRIMETLGVYPPTAVVKVGDTPSDMEEARNAGAWAVGVTRTGSEVGLTEAEWTALDPTQRRERLAVAEARLRAAGAHAVVESVADLLPALDALPSP